MLGGDGGAGGVGMGTGFTPAGRSTPFITTRDETPTGMKVLAWAAGSTLEPTVATKRSMPLELVENCRATGRSDKGQVAR